jgi:hypothetical protein
MSLTRVEVGHVRIAMHGLAPSAARTIFAGLEVALVARLGAMRTLPGLSRIEHADLGVLDLAPAMDERAIIDAIALRLANSIEGLGSATTGMRAE